MSVGWVLAEAGLKDGARVRKKIPEHGMKKANPFFMMIRFNDEKNKKTFTAHTNEQYLELSYL